MRLFAVAMLLTALCHLPLAAQAGSPSGSPAPERDSGAVLDYKKTSVLSLRPSPVPYEVALPSPGLNPADPHPVGAGPGDRLAAGISYGGLGGALLFGLTDTLVGPLWGDEPGLSLGLSVFLGGLAGMTVGGIAGLLGAF
jgi:hypothetical protein